MNNELVNLDVDEQTKRKTQILKELRFCNYFCVKENIQSVYFFCLNKMLKTMLKMLIPLLRQALTHWNFT